MFGYKSVVAVLAVGAMMGSSAFAADTSLAPGKPAGIHQAQGSGISTGALIIGGVALAVLAAVAITVSDQSNNGGTTGAFGTDNTNAVSTTTTTS